MNTILISEIEFDARPLTKTQEEHIRNLAKSIKENGLMTPVVLSEISPKRYRILDGWSRIAAYKDIGNTAIPAVIQNLTTEEIKNSFPRVPISTEEWLKYLRKLSETLPNMTLKELVERIG